MFMKFKIPTLLKLLTIIVLLAVAGLILIMLPLTAAAHGVEISSSAVSGVEITALYDSGQPMSGAQVSIFTPDDPLEPWLTGLCDEQGKFFFVPDYSRPGLWEVMVRQAGHGDLIRIEVTGSEEIIAGREGGLTTLQKVIISLTVLWGAVGTALYFSRREQ